MIDPSPPLRRVLLAHWQLKLGLGTVLTVLFCAGYFAIQQHPIREAVRLPLSVVDRWVPFAPSWVWVYESMYLMLPLAWLAKDRADLRRYAAGFIAVAIVGFGCFLAWPISGPRPVAAPAGGLYGQVIRYDTPLNCFPSLHIALATYSACVAVAVTGGALRRGLCIVLPVWVGLIGYATLATKQHYAADLLPGAMLGYAAQWLAWRPRSAPAAVTAGAA